MGNYKKFKVVPDLPENLKPLLDIASNLWLTWNPEAIKLFITLDGDLWEKSLHNPMRMLGEISRRSWTTWPATKGSSARCSGSASSWTST